MEFKLVAAYGILKPFWRHQRKTDYMKLHDLYQRVTAPYILIIDTLEIELISWRTSREWDDYQTPEQRRALMKLVA